MGIMAMILLMLVRSSLTTLLINVLKSKQIRIKIYKNSD